MSKIKSVIAHPASVPLKHTLWTAHEELKDSSVILVEVRTEDGIAGYGQIHGSPQKAICEWVARFGEVIRGMEANASVAVWEKLFALTSPRPGGMGGRDGLPPPLPRGARPQIIAAIAGIDIALWDIRGKAAGMPVYRLLRAERRPIFTYATGGYYIDACIAFARGRTAGRFLGGGAPAMVPPARGLPAACPGDADPARARRARAHPFHRARLHRLRRDPLRAVRRDGLRGASPRRCASRSPLNYSDQHLDDARQALTRLYTALKAVPARAGNVDWSEPQAARFHAAMNDDFNTPEAVAVLFDLANEINRSKSARAAVLLKSLGSLLGILQRDPVDFLQGGGASIEGPVTGHGRLVSGHAVVQGTGTVTQTPESIDRMIEKRRAARMAKNFAESDRIRDQLLAAGIVLEDAPAGTTWRRK